MLIKTITDDTMVTKPLVHKLGVSQGEAQSSRFIMKLLLEPTDSPSMVILGTFTLSNVQDASVNVHYNCYKRAYG